MYNIIGVGASPQCVSKTLTAVRARGKERDGRKGLGVGHKFVPNFVTPCERLIFNIAELIYEIDKKVSVFKQFY